MKIEISLSSNQTFVSEKTISSVSISVDAAMLKKAIACIHNLYAKFPFKLNVLKSKMYGNTYCLKPVDTILFRDKVTPQMLDHEIAHHVFHKMLTAAQRKTVVKLCKPFKGADPNEQFATTIEYQCYGTAGRVDTKNGLHQEIEYTLLDSDVILDLAGPYYKLPKKKIPVPKEIVLDKFNKGARVIFTHQRLKTDSVWYLGVLMEPANKNVYTIKSDSGETFLRRPIKPGFIFEVDPSTKRVKKNLRTTKLRPYKFRRKYHEQRNNTTSNTLYGTYFYG